MNSIWNKNIELFTNRFPSLAEMFKDHIKSEPECDFWKIEHAKNTSINAEQNGLKLHSAYNPQKEAETFFTSNQEKLSLSSAVVFLSCGLGYAPIAATEFAEEKTILIIEPEPQYFFSALKFIDWEKIFSLKKLIIALSCTPEQAITLINSSGGINESLFYSIKAQTLHARQYFDVLETLIQRNRTKEDINDATKEKFAKLWTKNSITNIQTVSFLNGITEFHNKAKNLPFLIIAAGPSLKNITKYFHKIKNKAITVCVDTALRACLQENFQPDFIILTDPQYWAYRHIHGLKSERSILITEAAVYPPVFRFPCKKILCCSSQLPIGKYFEDLLGTKGNLGAGGSVASTAWNFCKYAGAAEIYTCGLDLSYPQKQTHIKGSTFEQKLHILSTKTNPAENGGIKTLLSAESSISKNYLEEKVSTDSRMKMFAWWFESRIAECPETKTYTLSPESLKIPGITYIKIDTFLNKKDITAEKQAFLALTNNPDKNSSQTEKMHKFQQALNKYNQNADKIQTEVSQALKLCLQTEEKLRHNTILPQELDTTIEKLQSSLQKITTNPLAQIAALFSPGTKKTAIYINERKTQYPSAPQKAVLFYKLNLTFQNLSENTIKIKEPYL